LLPRRSLLSSGTNVIWPLQVMVVASLVAPALLFLYAGFANYRSIERHHQERLLSAVDVVEEHASKALQTIERTISETNEVLRDLSDEAIRAEEARLHARLQKTQVALPQIQSIWAFDRLGHPLVSSTVLPVPRALDNTDRDYFRAQAEADAGTYVGEVVVSKVGNHRFFVVSQRRPSPDGGFNGVIAVSVFPEHFREFYARMARGIADSFGLVRPDGAFLARYPSRDEGPMRLNPQSVFVQAIRTEPEAGLFTAVSQIDGVERRIGYRKVPDLPIYVQVGMETAAVWRELRATMLGHLVFGAPATFLLFGLSLYALRRTRGFHAEVGRREMAEAALKQAQRLEAIGQLTGGVAHDFNNLLMVVKGNAERLRRSGIDERQKRSLDAIETAAERGASLTRQLLSFSRKQTHEPSVVDLGQLLPELQEMLRSSLRGDIAVALKLADELWPIKVDLSEFELAILNVAVNARDAMPQGGQLTMSAQNVTLSDPEVIGRPGEFVALSIADTGSGIPPTSCRASSSPSSRRRRSARARASVSAKSTASPANRKAPRRSRASPAAAPRSPSTCRERSTWPGRRSGRSAPHPRATAGDRSSSSRTIRR
jgi:two-component system NtrC family sensor kinase